MFILTTYQFLTNTIVKKIKILFLMLLSSVFLHGQEYIPMLKENRVWSVIHEKFTLLGDTTINDLTYKKLYYHDFLVEFFPDSLNYIAAMREDTLNGKIYFIWHNHDNEVLLYDFSLEQGVTFQVNSPFFSSTGPVFFPDYINQRYLEVSEILEIEFGNQVRRALKLNRLGDPSFSEYWIEGIGSTVGLIYAGWSSYPIAGTAYPFLLCFHENNILIYQGDDPWGIDTHTCYVEPSTNVDDIEMKSFSINVWPTFFKDQIFLQSNSQAFKVYVYDLTGRMVYQFHSSESFTEITIPTSHWESGVYVIKLSDLDKSVTQKIIKLKN